MADTLISADVTPIRLVASVNPSPLPAEGSVSVPEAGYIPRRRKGALSEQVLAHLRAHPGARQYEIARAVGIGDAAVYSVLKTLMRRGGGFDPQHKQTLWLYHLVEEVPLSSTPSPPFREKEWSRCRKRP